MQLCLHGCLQYQLQQTCRILLCLQHIQNCVRLKTVYKTIHILQGSKLLDKRCLLCVQEYLMVMHEQICIMWQCLSVNLLNWRALMVLLASKRLCSTNFAAWLIWWWSYWESGKLTAFIPCINICVPVSVVHVDTRIQSHHTCCQLFESLRPISVRTNDTLAHLKEKKQKKPGLSASISWEGKYYTGPPTFASAVQKAQVKT